MAAISRADIRLVGSHTGVTVGEDGPSQMALEDIAMFRAVHGSTVLVTSDANQTAALTHAIVDRPGVVYLRTLRMATPVIYEPGEYFPIGGSRVLRASADDHVALLAAGVTVHEALAAADSLARDGITVRVIDLYSAKPLDTETVVEAARATGRLVIAEDHWAQGGLADAVLEALADANVHAHVERLAVTAMPTSGEPAELLRWAGIDRTRIAARAHALVRLEPVTAAFARGLDGAPLSELSLEDARRGLPDLQAAAAAEPPTRSSRTAPSAAAPPERSRSESCDRPSCSATRRSSSTAMAVAGSSATATPTTA
jgi:transketolase